MANPVLSSSLHQHINQSSATTGKGIESSPNWTGGFWIYLLLEMKEYNDLKPVLGVLIRRIRMFL
jgi:hypothetical protein